MATFSRVSPTGWVQGDDATAAARVTPTGWGQITASQSGGASSPPTAPTIGATTSITQTGATINWTDNSADETGFKVEYAASPYSAWTAAATTAADATSYALTGLIEKTTYKARVASTNANGDSAWVESAEFTTLAVPRGSLLGVG